MLRSALQDELRTIVTPLRDRPLRLLVALLVFLLIGSAQFPLRYIVDIGREDGPGSDLPILRGFFPIERFDRGYFRWTTAEAHIRLYGIGTRPATLALRTLPVNREVAERGARELELWSGQALLARLPVNPNGANYTVLLPPVASGDQEIVLRSAVFVPTGDERAVGVPIDELRAGVFGGPALPAAGGLFGWPAVLVLAWLAVRRAGISAREAGFGVGLAVLACAAGYLADAPRMALGVIPALIGVGLGGVLALVLRAAPAALASIGGGLGIVGVCVGLLGSPQIGGPLTGVAVLMLIGAAFRAALRAPLTRLLPPISEAAWSRLVLIAVLVLTIRYTGKIYPDSMPGDIGFHTNRYADVIRGKVLITSRNRGVDFPYPPAFYVVLAPWTLLGVDRPTQLRVGGALLDALSPLLIYAVAATLYRRRGIIGGRHPALAAAALYALAPAGQMTTWWNFSTHIFTQFAHLLLIAALILVWRDQTLPRRALAALFVLLQLLVYLGHFGFWMNTTLLGGVALAALFAYYPDERRQWRSRILIFVAAQLAAVLLFYSAYAGLFLAQAQATLGGGLTGLADRAPVGRDILWATLWDAGFRQHFGLFLIPAALSGAALLIVQLWEKPVAQHRLPVILIGGTVLIAAGFALLPFISGSTLSTRWLMFSAWVIAVAAPLAGVYFLRGAAARVGALAICGYLLWIGVTMWLAALAWRVRPPEPF